MIQTKNLMTNCLKFWKNKFFDLQMRTNDEIIPDINNLNDTRKPGQKNSWKPDMMPSGTNTYKMAAFDYQYEHRMFLLCHCRTFGHLSH